MIYNISELATNRVQVLEDARNGRATLRDKDGTSLVMLPESELTALEGLALWSSEQLRLERLLSRDSAPTVADLGSLAWLRVFDLDDQREFCSDLHDALIASLADRETAPVDTCVAEWRITARQLEDPLRRSVLLGSPPASAFESVDGLPGDQSE